MKQNSVSERLVNGIVKENPTFVLMLGMCPTLAVTTSAINGLGMGLTTMVVLALSNMFISMLRKVIPDKVRIPAFIVVIASFVTVVELLLKAYIPFLYDALGLYIPLIVVNCIILGRAEAYASKNGIISSLFDGVGMGLGFTVALTMIGAVRELLGAGEVFGYHVMPESYVPCSIFVLAPGAFFVLATLTAIQNKIKIAGEKKGKDMSKIQSGCNSDCMNCGESGCSKRFFGEDDKPAEEKIASEEKKVSGEKNHSEEKAESLVEKVKDAAEKAEDAVESVADKVEDAVENVADKVEDAIEDAVDKVKDSMERAAEKAEDIIEDAKEAVEEKIEDIKEAVKKDAEEEVKDND